MTTLSGTLRTCENNSMSLSCSGTIIFENGKVIEHYFKGMPRSYGDSWANIYKTIKNGDTITQKIIDYLLSYNGKNNILSSFDTNTKMRIATFTLPGIK